MLTGSYFDGELKTVALKVDAKTGLYFREGSSDLEMIADCLRHKDYDTVNCNGHKVLDLGGNIGAFCYKAAMEGAELVHTYEPEPNNYAMLLLNLEVIKRAFPNTVIIPHQEAVSNQHGNLELVIKGGHYGACTPSLTNKKRKGKTSTTVKVVPFSEVAAAFNPTLLKMDIEGAEYSFIFDGLPASIREFTFELHGQNTRDRELMNKCWEQYSSEWQTVRFTPKKIFNIVQLMTGHLKR